MVPLGNAHQSGAWSWPAERKELYANHLADPQHLIAVTASANRSKGARAPEKWKPEDESYWCQYAIDWVSIKNTWNLTATEPEHKALAEMLVSCDNPHVLIDAGDIAPTAPTKLGDRTYRRVRHSFAQFPDSTRKTIRDLLQEQQRQSQNPGTDKAGQARVRKTPAGTTQGTRPMRLLPQQRRTRQRALCCLH